MSAPLAERRCGSSLRARGAFDLGAGATASVHSVPGALKAEYGDRPISYMLFTRVKL